MSDGKANFVSALRISLNGGSTRDAKAIFGQIAAHHKSISDGAEHNFWTYAVQYGPGNTYVVLSPHASLADCDSGTQGSVIGERSSIGAASIDFLLDHAESLIGERERVLLEYLPAYSNHPSAEGDAPGPYLFHTRVEVAAGALADVKAAIAALVAAHRDGGHEFWTYGTFAGGNERVYHIVQPFGSYADLDGHTGDDAAAHNSALNVNESLLTDLDSRLVSVERTVLEYLPGYSNGN